MDIWLDRRKLIFKFRIKIFFLTLFVSTDFLRSMCSASASKSLDIKSQLIQKSTLIRPSKSLKSSVEEVKSNPLFNVQSRPSKIHLARSSTNDWIRENALKLSSFQQNYPRNTRNITAAVPEATSRNSITISTVPSQSKINSVPYIPHLFLPSKPTSDSKTLQLATSSSNSLHVHPSESIGKDFLVFDDIKTAVELTSFPESHSQYRVEDVPTWPGESTFVIIYLRYYL